ncbi:hypothetical protein BDZ89DRAFT_23632 [Hymenopellis radicata]|nr:hypothetical protein BDZ89DRAFT_766164 [Hymenopellis radicata]KAF9055528.1 hypothetical protein BDZ89DRAFT_23632 [Hymenopellis radicata]
MACLYTPKKSQRRETCRAPWLSGATPTAAILVPSTITSSIPPNPLRVLRFTILMLRRWSLTRRTNPSNKSRTLFCLIVFYSLDALCCTYVLWTINSCSHHSPPHISQCETGLRFQFMEIYELSCSEPYTPKRIQHRQLLIVLTRTSYRLTFPDVSPCDAVPPF